MNNLPWFLRDLSDVSKTWDGEYVVVDFETTGLDKGSALNPDNHTFLCSVWDSRTKNMRTLVGNELQIGGELVRLVNSVGFVVAHNAKFEAQWLARCGVELENVMFYCTQIGEAVLHGNLLAAEHRRQEQSLDHTAARYGLPAKISWVSKMIKQGLVEDVPRRYLQRYCERDVELCRDVFKLQHTRLKEEGKLPVFFTRMITMPVLADTEFNGMCLDREAVLEEYAKTYARYQELLRESEELTGGINMASPVQVAEYVYEKLGFSELTNMAGDPIRTPKGKPKADKDTLAALKATTPEQREFIELRNRINKVRSALSKNLEFFKGVVDEKGGEFKAQFNQTNTATHRLSSSGIRTLFNQFVDKQGRPKPKSVQFQNLPRDYKRLFRGREENWCVGEVDGAQLEFRVAVYLGQDKQGMKDVRNPEFDVHKLSAETIYGKTDDKVKFKKNRTRAKRQSFKPLYGGQSGTARERKYYKAFRDKYAGINTAQKAWVTEALKTGKVKAESGLEFFFPDTVATPSGYVKNSTNIHNFPVQSLATAEMIPISLVYFWHYLKRSNLKMMVVNTVHDSIIVELPREEISDFVELSRLCFGLILCRYLKSVYGIEWNVPLGVGIKTGRNWGVGNNGVWDLEGYEAPGGDLTEEYTEDYDPLTEVLA